MSRVDREADGDSLAVAHAGTSDPARLAVDMMSRDDDELMVLVEQGKMVLLACNPVRHLGKYLELHRTDCYCLAASSLFVVSRTPPPAVMLFSIDWGGSVVLPLGK